MTTTLLLALSIGSATSAFAQVPAEVQDFTSHGIHVIMRPSKANEVISAVMGFEGGLAYGETSNPVLANASAAIASESGSDAYPKEQYRDQLAKLSTSIGGSGNFYHTVFTLQTIRPNFDQAWNVLADLIVHPHFDTIEGEKLREQLIQSIEGRSSNPEGYSNFLVDSIWRGASMLNRAPTTADAQNLTYADLKNFHDKIVERSRAVFTIVGDVSKSEIESKLAALESLPQGTFNWPKTERITPQTGQFMFIPRELPTTYVEMRFPSASLRDNDWWAERVLFQILDKRLFDQVRTKRNLSYSPQGYATGDHVNFYGAMSYQSIYPDSAANVVFNVVKELQTTLVPKEELENAKAGRITTYYYATQKNLAQAQALYTDQTEAGDWRLFFRIVPETQKVTAEQVRNVARRYFHNLTFVVMGPEGKSTKSVYTYE